MSIVQLNATQRALLFLLVCVPVRSSLVAGTKSLPRRLLPVAGVVGLLVALGFATRRMGGAGAFGGQVWWNRPAHAMLWGTFGLAALAQHDKAWGLLLLDLVFGLLAFLVHEATA